MQRCPLNSFEDCINEECPFFNIRLGACVLPRLVLTTIRANEKTLNNELMELNYEKSRED